MRRALSLLLLGALLPATAMAQTADHSGQFPSGGRPGTDNARVVGALPEPAGVGVLWAVCDSQTHAVIYSMYGQMAVLPNGC